MSTLALDSGLTLRSGNKIPQLGFGVAFGFGKTEDPLEITKPALLEALKVGYKHVDTAQMYRNEKLVGEAIRESGIDRGQIFVTSKVASSYAGYDKATDIINESLKLTGFDYLDLYLIHSAASGTARRIDTWKALLDAKKAGKVRDIGVSNYNVKHLEEIKQAGLEMPAVNQIELHPLCQQKEIVDYCSKNNIIVEPYCSVIRGALNNPVILEVAKKHNKDAAQILLRWSLQRGFVPLVRSSQPVRIRSNADLYDFALDGEDMKRLNDLDRGAAGSISWNPVDVE